MSKCTRCGTYVSGGQRVCPRCGKPQRPPRRVRCRHCGTTSNSSLSVCPGCGERLQRDWTRSALAVAAILIALGLTLTAGRWLQRALAGYQPAVAVSTIQALAANIPAVVEVPSLTPSLTPSITPSATPTPTPSPIPTHTHTPTPTLTPSLTPTPTSTPTPSATATATTTPTATRPRATPTRPPTSMPTATPTAPAIPSPTLLRPEDGVVFQGQSTKIELTWTSDHTLRAGEYFEILLRYSEESTNNEIVIPAHVQRATWFVDSALYGQASQRTERAYHWSIRVVRREVGDDGTERYVPLGALSAERTFYWR